MASPIPVPAPVTIAILSFKRIDEPFPARSAMALRAASRPIVLESLVVLEADLLTQLKIAVRLASLMAHEDGANRHDDSRDTFAHQVPVRQFSCPSAGKKMDRTMPNANTNRVVVLPMAWTRLNGASSSA